MTYFHAPSHTYWHSTDGATWRQLPSVTQVIAGREPRAVPRLAAAQVRGTAVHAATAALHLGGDSTVDPAWQGYVDAYLRACADRPVEWVYVEQVLADPDVGVAGTVDRFGLVDGTYTVVDLKTTTTPTGRTAAHGHQLAGYAVLIDAAQPEAFARQVWLLRDDGTYDVQRYDDRAFLDYFLMRAATARGDWHGPSPIDTHRNRRLARRAARPEAGVFAHQPVAADGQPTDRQE